MSATNEQGDGIRPPTGWANTDRSSILPAKLLELEKIALVLLTVSLLARNERIEAKIGNSYCLNHYFRSAGQRVCVRDLPRVRAHVHFDFVRDLDDHILQ